MAEVNATSKARITHIMLQTEKLISKVQEMSNMCTMQ